jgi:hypothetical protein
MRNNEFPRRKIITKLVCDFWGKCKMQNGSKQISGLSNQGVNLFQDDAALNTE